MLTHVFLAGSRSIHLGPLFLIRIREDRTTGPEQGSLCFASPLSLKDCSYLLCRFCSLSLLPSLSPTGRADIQAFLSRALPYLILFIFVPRGLFSPALFPLRALLMPCFAHVSVRPFRPSFYMSSCGICRYLSLRRSSPPYRRVASPPCTTPPPPLYPLVIPLGLCRFHTVISGLRLERVFLYPVSLGRYRIPCLSLSSAKCTRAAFPFARSFLVNLLGFRPPHSYFCFVFFPWAAPFRSPGFDLYCCFSCPST